MSKFDPPSDPYGNEKYCRICDEPLEWNSLIREWECTHDHDAANVEPQGTEHSPIISGGEILYPQFNLPTSDDSDDNIPF